MTVWLFRALQWGKRGVNHAALHLPGRINGKKEEAIDFCFHHPEVVLPAGLLVFSLKLEIAKIRTERSPKLGCFAR